MSAPYENRCMHLFDETVPAPVSTKTCKHWTFCGRCIQDLPNVMERSLYRGELAFSYDGTTVPFCAECLAAVAPEGRAKFLQMLDALEDAAIENLAHVSRMQGALAVDEDIRPDVVRAGVSLVIEYFAVLEEKHLDLLEHCVQFFPEEKRSGIETIVRERRIELARTKPS